MRGDSEHIPLPVLRAVDESPLDKSTGTNEEVDQNIVSSHWNKKKKRTIPVKMSRKFININVILHVLLYTSICTLYIYVCLHVLFIPGYMYLYMYFIYMYMYF